MQLRHACYCWCFEIREHLSVSFLITDKNAGAQIVCCSNTLLLCLLLCCLLALLVCPPGPDLWFLLFPFLLFANLCLCLGSKWKTGGVLHRWLNCSPWPQNGPCWCHHCWWEGWRQREDLSPPVSWSCSQYVPCPAGQHYFQG